jgi:hypothetical protein
MALDRSPDLSNLSEQLPTQASRPSFMTVESKNVTSILLTDFQFLSCVI